MRYHQASDSDLSNRVAVAMLLDPVVLNIRRPLLPPTMVYRGICLGLFLYVSYLLLALLLEQAADPAQVLDHYSCWLPQVFLLLAFSHAIVLLAVYHLYTDPKRTR